jgi:hypothetical protein
MLSKHSGQILHNMMAMKGGLRLTGTKGVRFAIAAPMTLVIKMHQTSIIQDVMLDALPLQWPK